MISILVFLSRLSLLSSGLATLSVPTDNSLTQETSGTPMLTTTFQDWPPPSTRYPLYNYEGGFLMFRDYGVEGSAVSFFIFIGKHFIGSRHSYVSLVA